jgi:Tfp pilus assembly protein PilF
MKRAFVTSSVLAAALVFSACGSHHDLQRSQTQDNFGVQMARTNLWREAQFRFQRAVEINPQNAMAHNNLAVALEANGDFEKARREYLEALKLDKGNQYIQKNYSRFTEFLQRNKKRQQRGSETKPATAKATTAPQSPPPLPPVAMPGADQPGSPMGGVQPPSGPPTSLPQPPPPLPQPPGGSL